tara:strand:+ start:208 stop:3009 length:2802 start_codon:yes stop_codon:yes gene_type:complete
MSEFIRRHIGPSEDEQQKMIDYLSYSSMEDFVKDVVPESILIEESLNLPNSCSEKEALNELQYHTIYNDTKRSLLGNGYYGTIIPSVIKRNVFENPAWYTSYTPYQAEISQGRLEALFNFQTLITELTGLPIANASLLDEGTAAAEAMIMAFNAAKSGKNVFHVDATAFKQTIEVLKTRAEPLGIEIKLFHHDNLDEIDKNSFGVFCQYLNYFGNVNDVKGKIQFAKERNVLSIVAVDPMLQVLLQPVGELGADIAIGSMQRFGVPMGYGGPHAAFFATTEKFQRKIPGRIVGQSVDSEGNTALRLALQTREQHIRRDKATSNICTAQALLAVMSFFYAAYHGPEGLHNIARHILSCAKTATTLINNSEKYQCVQFQSIFDTIIVTPKDGQSPDMNQLHVELMEKGINTNYDSDKDSIMFSFDECVTVAELTYILNIFTPCDGNFVNDVYNSIINGEIIWGVHCPPRIKPWAQQECFHKYHSETELMRYIYRLAKKDFTLVDGMIPLGSCTMKLNSAAELTPVSWESFANIHPFVPDNQVSGYKKMIEDVEQWLCNITGFDGMFLQPNAGSQGEYAGLLTIRSYHRSRGDSHRDVCLIPTSAHGTNPASSVMAGMKVVAIKCKDNGDIDLNDLREKASANAENLACIMVTYPSTHGVFEPGIRDICEIVHEFGGQVYMDGANLNAQVGLCKPGEFGIDVCHLNLHKTFCIPHGGGGPGVGPIGFNAHLLPHVPQHVSAAPQGSASILPITWMYIRMMGSHGLRKATEVALLNANWVADQLEDYFPVLYRGPNNRIAHECILDIRPFKQVTAEDVAKRLMDYGFHAPTLSWPVAGTVMVEPTESESLEELQRFVDAMKKIRNEIDTNPELLKNAPHTARCVSSSEWDRSYSREDAAYPMNQKDKFWPVVSRIDNVYGDRNLVCSCSVEMKDFDE